MIDLSLVGANGRLLDQQDIQVLGLLVVDESFHPRPRLHDIQL